MLLFRLDTRLSGCQRNIYMTSAQERLAKTGQAFSDIFDRTSGVIRDERGCMSGWIASLARARATRAKT